MKFVILLLCFVIVSCNVDKMGGVEFEIDNQHDEDVQVRFVNYREEGWKDPVDTTFTIPAAGKMSVYFHELKAQRAYTFLTTEKLMFCDSIKVSSMSVRSERDLLQAKEWSYDRNTDFQWYTAKITAEDF